MNFNWHRRALDSIHHGALTNSKRPECFVKGIYPTHLTKAEDCYVYDSEGKKYVDFICALGSNLLGYANPQLNEAIIRQIHKGTNYSLSSTLEVEAAEKIKEIIPFVSKVRFLKSGTDAASAALRISLAHSGRQKILSAGYHGWSDAFVSLSESAVGIPPQPYIETLNSLDQINEETACVIVEPIITDHSKGRIEYLLELQAKCKKEGALLIFDEIITGFRFPNFCFSNYCGIQPDIILLGKAIGGGLPLSVVGTKSGIGEGKDWFVSSTFAGDTTALAGMIKMVELLTNTYKISQLWESGENFISEFNKIAPEIIKIEGYPSRGVFIAEPMKKALFFQESCKAGLLFGPSFFYNFAHIKLNDIVINSCRDILMRIKNNQVSLEGEMPISPLAQRIREKEKQ